MVTFPENEERLAMNSGVSGVPLPDLTIVGIETIPIRVPLDRVYKGSHYQMTHRSTIITKIRTASGITGVAYAGDEDAGLLEINDIINNEIGPLLIGEDAFAVEKCWELTRPATWNILRDRRLGLVASASLDVAIWDAIGKAFNTPLWKLWGGYRNEVPVITIGGYYAADANIEAEVSGLVEAQFAGMKFKVGGLSPEEDVERVRIARKVAGPDFGLAVDANQGWTPQEAIRFSQLAQDLNLMWFEEPCHWQNDRRAMREVRSRGTIPICAGQSECSAAGCRDLMETGSIDYCNFDSSWSGGPTEWRRVAAMATVYDVKMAHHEEAHVSAHLLASIPHGTFVEFFHAQRDPIWHNLIANAPPLINGKMKLSDRPGLGWELDEDYIKKYQI